MSICPSKALWGEIRGSRQPIHIRRQALRKNGGTCALMLCLNSMGRPVRARFPARDSRQALLPQVPLPVLGLQAGKYRAPEFPGQVHDTAWPSRSGHGVRPDARPSRRRAILHSRVERNRLRRIPLALWSYLPCRNDKLRAAGTNQDKCGSRLSGLFLGIDACGDRAESPGLGVCPNSVARPSE